MWKYRVMLGLCSVLQVENYVISGQKLEIESGDTSESVMPPQLSTVMEACFAYTPLHRPSAFDLREHIHNILFPIRLPHFKY